MTGRSHKDQKPRLIWKSMKWSPLAFLICVAVAISTVLGQSGVQISWQDEFEVGLETPSVRAAGANVTNDPVGDLVVFSQDYTSTATVPSNVCLALDSMTGHVENMTLMYNSTSHCVQVDATEGSVGQLFVGGLSPSLSTTITLDMGMGRTEDHATVNVFAGGAWLGIRLSSGTPTDDLVMTSYYYTYSNPTLHSETSVTQNVGFSGSGRFEIRIVSDCIDKTNTIYLNDVEKLTTPYTRYKPYDLAPFYDPFVNPFIYFEVSSIYPGQTAYLQLYSIEQTVPEYSHITPISNPKLISFGIDGPHAWNTVDWGLSLLDGGTIWADVKYIDNYSQPELAALKALVADGFELGIHYSARLSDLSWENATELMDIETASITATFGELPTSWCSLQGGDDMEHAEYAYTNFGMVSRNGVNGSAGGLSKIGNLGDNCWNFWSSASAAGIVIPSFSHELDISPAIAWSISPDNFSTFVSNYGSNGIQIVGFREYWEKAQNSYHTDISNVVSEPGVSLSFTVDNIGGRSRLLVNAPWANVVQDGSGGNVPFEAYGSGIVIEVEAGDYTVAAVSTTAPTVATNAASNLAPTTATLNGNLTSLGTAGSVLVSFEWGTAAGGPYTEETGDQIMTSPGTFSADLTGLTPGNPFYFRAKAVGHGRGRGDEVSFSTSTTAPTVATNDASNLAPTSATLNGSVSDRGTASSVIVSFEWGTVAGGPYPNVTDNQTMDNAGSFTASLTDLAPGTTYYYKASAVGHGTTLGDEVSFTTSTTAPTVSTGAASNLATTTATLNGNLTSLGTDGSVVVSFEWGATVGGPYPNVTASQTTTSTGAFIANLTDLSAGTTYYCRAKAIGHGTTLGDEVSFTTSTTPPTVTTGSATSLATTLATLNGNLGSLSTASSVAVSFEWGTTTSYGSETTAQLLTAIGAFSANLTGLTANTTYHFRAKAIGHGATVYGEDMTFTTAGLPDTALPVISQVNALEITTSGATIKWTTNEPATSRIEYGLTEECGLSTNLDANLVTTHSVGLTGLKAGRTYHYRVISRDTSNNETMSGYYTFTTSSNSGGMPVWAWVPISLGVVAVAGAAAFLHKGRLKQG